MDGKDGVWRTIRGRRVFIAKGESLGQAMSKSGKFKREDIREGKREAIIDEHNKNVNNLSKWKKTRKLRNKIYTPTQDNQAPKNRIVENGRINEQGKTRVERNKARYSETDRRELSHEKIQKKLADYKAKKQSNNKVDDNDSKFLEKRRKEIEYERANNKYTGSRETNEDGSYKYEKERQEFENSRNQSITNRDAKDLFKQLNDEGSDFSFDDDVEIKDGKIKTSVGVFMPDDRGYTTRDVEIPIDKNETYASLEEKVRDWQSRHSSPDSFYDNDFEDKVKEEKIKTPRVKKGKNDWLPKATKIKEQGKSNRKEVSENIQAHILEHFDSPQAFVEQMDAYDHLPTNWHRGQEMAKDGFFSIYYDDQRKFLDDLKINPKGKNFNDDRVFQTYTSLIGRESAKLYDRIKKHEQDTIKNYKKKKGK